MKARLLITMLLLPALSEKVTAGPLDALKNFFGHQQQQHHVVHPRHKQDPGKQDPNKPDPGESGSPSPLVSPAPQPQDPQGNTSPTPNPLNAGGNQRGPAPTIAAAPLY